MTPTLIPIQGTTNLRDIGGYEALDGGRIRPDMVLRGEVLAREGALTRVAVYREDLAADYAALGLSTIIDMRGAYEVEGLPNAWPMATGGRLVELPMDAGGEGDATVIMRAFLDGSLTHFGVADMARFYTGMARDMATTLGRAIMTLARPGALPALVHCTAGKDRTGMTIALLLHILGTPREQILTDYQYTEVLRPNRVEAYRDRLTAVGVRPEDVRMLFEAPAAVMDQTLDGLAAEYGSVEGYLTGPAGVDPAAFDRLRAALVD